jgi:hypothetical protein
MTTTTDIPNGFKVVSPLATTDKTLVLDIKCFLASKRLTRNVLSTRNAVKGVANIYEEAGFVLPVVKANGAPSEYEYVHKPGNLATILVSNRLVGLKIKTVNGVLDLGLTTSFILTSSLVSMTITNTMNEGDAELNLIVV